MSEVYSKQEQAGDFFETLFENARKGSLFLFVDNSGGYSARWFDTLVKAYNQLGGNGYLKIIKRSDQHKFQMESNELVKDLEPYYSKFGRRLWGFGSNNEECELPKLSSPVDYRICLKI